MTYLISIVIVIYLSIAFWRHYQQKDINYKIVLEYFLFALLGATLVLSIISFK